MNAHSCGKDHSCKDVDGTFRCKKKKEWTTIILGKSFFFNYFVYDCVRVKRDKIMSAWES